MKLTDRVQKVLDNAGPGPFFIPVNVPTEAWLSLPQNNDEFKALINTMILREDIRQAKRADRREEK